MPSDHSAAFSQRQWSKTTVPVLNVYKATSLVSSFFNVSVAWINKTKCADYVTRPRSKGSFQVQYFLTNKCAIFTALFLPRVVKSLKYMGDWR